MAAVAVLSIAPLWIEPASSAKPLQLDFLPPYASSWLAWATKAAVLLAMLASIRIYVKFHPDVAMPAIGLCMALAGAMIVIHWVHVDANPSARDWQKMVYTCILNHSPFTPHVFRPLPYGFTRLLEWVTRDWTFSCLAYRWFFSFWFLLASYQFARLWLSPGLSHIVTVTLGALYYCSVKTYYGQLTDPMSHWLFVMALVYVVEDEWIPLGVALVIGILAKETAILILPAYWACWRRKGWPAFGRTVILGALCAVSFLVVRLPYGWGLQYQQINGTEGSMLWANLRILKPCFPHLARCFIIFIPFIIYAWREIDVRLKILCLTVVPLVLVSNFCFGWIHEARNYMPLVPVLATSALFAFPRGNCSQLASTAPRGTACSA